MGSDMDARMRGVGGSWRSFPFLSVENNYTRWTDSASQLAAAPHLFTGAFGQAWQIHPKRS
jgi:hypothetical protein